MTLQGVSIDRVRITSDFWSQARERARTKTVPAIIEAQKAYGHWPCLSWKEGHHIQPHQFWDSDIYKAVEATCYFLRLHPDPHMLTIVEDAVNMIREAQHPDGYINSYYTVRGIHDRWTNLRDDHELYCMGHLLEAVIAYETLTNNGRLLEVATKLCKHLDDTFGTTPGKRKGYPGHQEIEIGLLRLYEFTADPLPLKLARYFILERGQRDDKDEIYYDHEAFARGADPYDFIGSEHKAWFHGPRDYGYQQADQPLASTTEVKGHAVRAMYYYTAATDLVRLCPVGDSEVAELRPVLGRLWRDLIDKKMYVTGGIGSVRQSEGFGPAYLLPDLEAEGCYAETCAAFALINWCNRLLHIDLCGEYGDVMEIALYNSFLGAVSIDGDAFYYQNILRTTTESPKERSKWFGVACCPPNVAKLLGNISSLIYGYNPEQRLVAIHQYVANNMDLPEMENAVSMTTSMPWAGEVTVEVRESVRLALRIPGWATGWTCSRAGRLTNGYLYLDARAGEVIRLNLPVHPRQVYANPQTGKDEICIMRGPLVYCIESVDNIDLSIDNLKLLDGSVGDGPKMSISTLKDVQSVVIRGIQCVDEPFPSLYGPKPWKFEQTPRQVTAVPFFLRANRGGTGTMRVWTPRAAPEVDPKTRPLL